MPATNTSYDKLVISLRYYFLGKGYTRASQALDFAMSIHTGFRADKTTPEFQHQLEMCHFLRSLSEANLMYPEETYCVMLLHDAYEDYPEKVDLNKIEENYSKRVRISMVSVSKPANFNKDDQHYYFNPIARDEIASLVKGIDRINNLGSMVGVFSKTKQIKYVSEVEVYFLPMLKKARRSFPVQEPLYENIKYVLNSQISLLKEALKYE